MKKCVVISCFDYYAIRTKQIIELFQKKGFQTTYLIADFNHFSKNRDAAEHPGGVKLPVPAYRKNLSPARLYSHHVFSRKAYRQLCDIRPDVVYCMFPPNSLVRDVVQYKKKFGTYLIFDCFDFWPESFPYKKFGKLLELPFECWRRLRDNYVEAADKMIVVSEAAEKGWKQIHPNMEVSVIPPYIDAGELPAQKTLQKDAISFCYLGMINHITDIDLGIRLLGDLQKNRKVTLHLIGEGQNKDAFVAGLEQVGVQVIQHGVVFDMDKKNEIFSQCDMGLNIPRPEIQSTMPLKGVEYMRAGLPFLNSASGDIRRIVETEQIGFNIDAQDLSMAAERIAQLKEADMKQLRGNCIAYYNKRTAEQNDLESVLGESLT